MSKNSYRKYIDAEGVQRGYYVYLHKEVPSGRVFYVGKGIGRRAWETGRRSNAWKEHIASLQNGWEVEIVESDLSEAEAFDLERQLIDQYGGSSHVGGTLTNIAMGGEGGLSLGISIHWDDHGWSEAYYQARHFKEMTRQAQEGFVCDLKSQLESWQGAAKELEWEAAETGGKLEDDAGTLTVHFDILDGIIYDFLKRRTPWKDVAIGLEEFIDDLESDKQDFTRSDKRVVSICDHALNIGRVFLAKIDSGNAKEAEAIADRISNKKKSEKAGE